MYFPFSRVCVLCVLCLLMVRYWCRFCLSVPAILHILLFRSLTLWLINDTFQRRMLFVSAADDTETLIIIILASVGGVVCIVFLVTCVFAAIWWRCVTHVYTQYNNVKM